MRLYFNPFSSNARRALLAARHLGVAVDIVSVDLAKGEQRTPEFLKLNPNGRVPVLVDGDFVLTESHAIMQYLADGVPGQTVYPVEREARADVNRWLFWSAQHFQPAIGVLGFERFVKQFLGKEPDPKEIARGEGLFHEVARVLDAHLATREWVARGTTTLADFAIAAALLAKDRAKLPIGDYRHVLGWYERVQALPAWKAAEG
jgi:glutathione S-transferase